MLSPPPEASEAFRKKTLALMAYLAVEARPVARDSLAALFWPEYPEQRARSNLRRVIFCLRDLLGNAAILTEQDCVLIDPSSLGLDIRDFERLVRDAPPGGSGMMMLEAAAALYRDRFMAGFGLPDCPDYDDWQLGQSVFWSERAASALNRLYLGYRDADQLDKAEACAQRLVSIDPLDQNAHRLLMRHYADTGQPEKAERQFRACASILRDQLGIAPDSRTLGLRAELRPTRAAPGVSFGSGLLPRYESSYMGRDSETEAIVTALGGSGGIFSITGPGGAGKTRLAAEAAARLADGHGLRPVFVDLAGVADPARVLPDWARSLGWRERGGPGALTGGEAALVGIIADRIRDGRSVVILDNFERVAASAPAVQSVAERAPGARIIVTSRLKPGIASEREIRLGPLALPPPGRTLTPRELSRYSAVALLADRASSARPGRAFDETSLRDVALLAARLDGLPLALELAAARLRYMTPGEALGRLDTALSLRADGWTDLPDRQLSMVAAIAWSFDTLSPDARRFLCALAVCEGGFDLALAEALWHGGPAAACDGSGDAGDASARLLDSLVSRSLVDRSDSQRGHDDASSQVGADGSRYRMLECIREFCLSRADPAEAMAARLRHALRILRIAESLADACRGPDQEHCLDRLEREAPNLGQASAYFAERGMAEEALRLGAALHWFWYRRGRLSEGIAALGAAFRLPEAHAAPPRVRADALRAFGWLLFVRDEWDQATRAFTASAAEAAAAGYDAGRALALCFLGVAERWLGDRDSGTRHCAEGLALARTTDDDLAIATALIWSYATVGGRGLDAEALQGLEETLALSRRCGEPWLEAHALEGLGDYHREAGDLHQAAACFNAALEAFARLKDDWMAAWSLEGLGRTELSLGRRESALARLARSRALFSSLGDLESAAYVLALEGRAELERGDARLGARMLGACRSFMDAPRTGRNAGHAPADGALEEAFGRAAREQPDDWARGRLEPITDFTGVQEDARPVGA